MSSYKEMIMTWHDRNEGLHGRKYSIRNKSHTIEIVEENGNESFQEEKNS